MRAKVTFFVLALMLASHIFAETFPAEELSRRLTERRAVEAVIWEMPAVNFDRPLQAAIQNGGGANQVIFWSRPFKVWQLTYDEIRPIPLGRDSTPEFRNEVTPTLDALLAETKGRIKINIELKYYRGHQPGLAQKVIEAVRSHGMLDQMVIQSLEYEPLLEVHHLAPEVPVGYLLSFNAREPSLLKVDFLSVEQHRLDYRFARKAHQRGQQVYASTVDTFEKHAASIRSRC